MEHGLVNTFVGHVAHPKHQLQINAPAHQITETLEGRRDLSDNDAVWPCTFLP